MVKHSWSTENDFQYCTLTDCEIVNGKVQLKSDKTSGTILSEIADSTNMIGKYDEFIFSTTAPAGTTIAAYYRTGTSEAYSLDYWSDWILYDNPARRIEYTLSLTDQKIITDYDIATIHNIYTEGDYRWQVLRQGLTDKGIVDLAVVDYDPGEITQYAEDAIFRNNEVRLNTPLDVNNVNVMVEYTPCEVVLDTSDRYVQWKGVLTADVAGNTPLLNSVEIGYKLTIQSLLESKFPMMFRRL